MSSDEQNPRSPHQQQDTIEATFIRLQYPWKVRKVYVDEGISGRLTRKRAGFQQMLGDIRTGKIQVDAILVDTFERFGRTDQMSQLRMELLQHYGVLVLTADTQFSDPTSVAGKVLVAFESLRATEENRVKAHNVLRGKRDAAQQRHWPGGSPPFGYLLNSVIVDRNGRQEVDYCTLKPDPETAWIIRLLFATAHTKGWGSRRLARMLNENPSISEKHKPFLEQTVNRWLGHPIYYGELVWAKHSTDVINDRHVVERNADDDILRVDNFCEPLVSKDVWDAVQETRRARSERIRISRQAKDNNGKQIAPLTPGLALSYVLSGLIRCGHCNRSMTVTASCSYTTKLGEKKRYVKYHCPGHASGVCPNSTRVSETWLRETVVDLIRSRLFPSMH